MAKASFVLLVFPSLPFPFDFGYPAATDCEKTIERSVDFDVVDERFGEKRFSTDDDDRECDCGIGCVLYYGFGCGCCRNSTQIDFCSYGIPN